MIRLVFSNMEVFMRTLSKISIVLISVLMIFTLSISAFAVPNMHYNFSLSFQGCVYTSRLIIDDVAKPVAIHCDAIYGSDNVKVTICDSNHRPVSNTITISKAPDVKYLSFNSYTIESRYYYLRFYSDNHVSISGYWTP